MQCNKNPLNGKLFFKKHLHFKSFLVVLVNPYSNALIFSLLLFRKKNSFIKNFHTKDFLIALPIIMKNYITLTLLLLAFTSFSQKEKFVIDWGDSEKKSGLRLENNLHLELQDDGSWVYSDILKIASPINESATKLGNVTYEAVPPEFKINLKKIPTNIAVSFVTTKARDQYKTSIRISPFVNKNGQAMMVTGGDIEYAFSKSQQAQSNVPSITNSLLASGNYYKFYVESTGAHRITRNFMESLGMSLNNINPNNIKVYGYGGSPLPFRNSDNTVFDLREVPIQVVGGGDGSFNGNDHVLFYGESTSKYHPELDTNINPYSDRSYYYITVDGGSGLRMQPYQEPTGAASVAFTTYDQYVFHEEDLVNFGRIGRRWFGEQFGFENEQTFEFEVPNATGAEEARVRIEVAAVAESNSSFDFAVNGVSVGSVSLGTTSTTTAGAGGGIDVMIPISSPEVTVTVTYNNNGIPSSLGYLDFISLDVPSALSGTGNQFLFKKNEAATLSGIGTYTLSNALDYSQVWEVTDMDDIRILTVDESSNTTFKSTLGVARQFLAVTPNDYFTPSRESGNALVANQNLKGSVFTDDAGNFQDVDYLMITSDLLRSQAERLAQHNRDFRGLRVKTVTIESIYEEFGGGRQDIGAIRNFVRYVYENASSEANRLRYLCLFGDTSVDYKDRLNGNNNVMPTYHTYNSFSFVSSFMSDDYFGALDPNEGWMEASSPTRPHVPSGGGNDRLDLAVGRIVADTPELATIVVNKIINYDARESYGRWRNNFVLVSDDVDEAFEFDDLQGTLDELGDEISLQKPFVNVYKIHSDAFQQQSSAGGDRYPQVNEAIENAIEVGSLVVSYLGHGGEERLAAESIVTANETSNLDNGERLPLVMTVTCEYGKFDNPERPTGGEDMFWNPDGGAVALLTTTREINVSLGVDFNQQLVAEIFSFGSTIIESVGENLRQAKNNISSANRRVVFYVGDPAMKLAFARPDILLTAINDIPVGQELPNLRALDAVKINGRVTSQNGQTITGYTGVLAVTIFDKRIDRQTLGNDGVEIGGELAILDFTTLGAILYRGQASVVNGQFEFNFVMPRDTGIPLGNGRINFYAERLGVLEDQSGANEDVIIGGLNENAPEDNLGPRIQLFMNDEGFVNGGITNDSPIILAKLEDENGINTASGIGHDIVAIIDGDETNPIIMNDFYETEIDDFMRGTAARKIRNLEPGPHTLTFKAWDVYNNSSTAELDFVVIGDEELELENVLNYPNPFVNYTEFWFNHNRAFEPLDVQVQIFTVSGKVVKTINQSVVTDGFLSRDITWDGLDDFGQRIGKGVYVYKITVKSTLTNKRVEKIEKLVIL